VGEFAQRVVSAAIGFLELVSKPPSYRALGAALGLSHTMARKLHEKQGMPRDSTEAAVAWYAQNGHHRGAGNLETKARAGFQGAPPPPPVSTVDPETLPQQALLNRMLTAARVRVTDLEAKQAEVDGQIRDGLLVKAEDVKRIGAARAVALRDHLLRLPAELALRLAAMTDPVLVADLLRKSLKAALNEFCDALGASTDSR
jgi:hypothetical protein